MRCWVNIVHCVLRDGSCEPEHFYFNSSFNSLPDRVRDRAGTGVLRAVLRDLPEVHAVQGEWGCFDGAVGDEHFDYSHVPILRQRDLGGVSELFADADYPSVYIINDYSGDEGLDVEGDREEAGRELSGGRALLARH